MNELMAVKKLGIATSKEVMEMVNTKNWFNIIRQLDSYAKLGEIKIIKFHKGGLYVDTELYEDIFEA